MKIIKVKDNNEAGKVAGEIILNKLKTNPNVIFGLATGSTPITTYQYVIEKTKEQNLYWSKVTTFNLDEYKGLDDNHDQSYRYFMNQNLFNHINIDKNNTFIPSGLIESDEQAKEYDKKIQETGGIELQLLGLGINGHIGFNEPGTSFDSLTSIVDLTQSTIEANARFFEKQSDVPTQAISMGLKSIMNVKEILLIATGQNKAEAIKHLVEGQISTDWPCSILQKHNNVIVIVDEQAASLLSK